MAEIAIAGIFTEREVDRFVRDCTKPASTPTHHVRKTGVLTIATDCRKPDLVIINGAEFYPRVEA